MRPSTRRGAMAAALAFLTSVPGVGAAVPPVGSATVQRMDTTDIGDPHPECVAEVADGRTVRVAAEGISP